MNIIEPEKGCYVNRFVDASRFRGCEGVARMPDTLSCTWASLHVYPSYAWVWGRRRLFACMSLLHCRTQQFRACLLHSAPR